MGIKVGHVIHAKNLKTGKRLSAIRRNVKRREHAPKIFLGGIQMTSHQKRLTNEQLKARLIVFIGVSLALTFTFSVAGMLYALIFVTQPLGDQAPNDRAFIELLSTLTIFLTGALGSVLASNGLKDKATTPKSDSGSQSDPQA